MQEKPRNAAVLLMRRCGTSPFPALGFGFAPGNGRPQPFPSADFDRLP
jgi:hypothetical protein